MEIKELLNLGYNGNVSEEDFKDGPPNIEYVNIVSWLSLQLSGLCGIESYITPINDVDDSLGFLVEVSSLLKELGCPYKSLVEGQISDRLTRSQDKTLLITYLCTELEAVKIISLKNPVEKPKMQIELEESKTAKELREMLVGLRFSKPPDTITPQQLFGEVEKKLKLTCQPSTPKEKVGELLFTGCLTEKQWFQLDHLYKEMYDEYKTRRNLLLTRLDVTVESFLWADRLKAKSGEIKAIYNKRKSAITKEPSVGLCHVLAATADIAVLEKTSSGSVRKNTKSSVNKVIIGAVPDRGGRPEEQQPPPPEVPSWQKSDSSSRGGFKQSNPPPSNTGYNRDNSGYNRDNTSYNRDNTGYNRESTGYKNTGYSRDENSNARASSENIYKGSGDMSRNNYKGGRNDYNPPPPVYQPVNYCAPLANPQFGFGGYMPAGDNFQQFGMADGMAQMNQYQSRGGGAGGPRGSGHRGGGGPRGGYSDRGSNQSRGGRGGGRGQRRYQR